MVRDRVALFFGAVIAVLSALVLVFAGSQLLYVVRLFHEPPEGWGNDLNLAQVAAASLAVGLCLVIYALGVAWRVRRVNRSARLGLMAAGALMLLSGVLLLVAFQNVAVDLEDLDASGRLKPGHTELPGDLERVMNDQRGRVTAGFWMLLIAQVVLGMGLWPMFWSATSPHPPDRLTRLTAWTAAAAAVGFSSLFYSAAAIATGTLTAHSPLGNHGFARVLSGVHYALILARISFAGLIVYGAALLLISVLFRGTRD